jgi:tetratricopeptide (TPR) repeat protein/DNA-binding CsgD family transcriptional regulator
LYKHLFEYDSIKAFGILNSIADLAKLNGDDELVLEMQLMKADYYGRGKQNNKDLGNVTLLELLAEAQKQKNKQILVRTYSSLSAYYQFTMKNPGLTLEYTLRSYYLLKELSVKDFPNKMDLVAGAGGAYHNFGDDETAKRLMLEALSYGESYKPWFNVMTNTNLGLIYQENEKYDSAIYFFKRARQIEADRNNQFGVLKQEGNIGEIYFNQGKYKEAIPLVQASANAYQEHGDPVNTANALTVLGAIYVQTGDLKNAGEQLLRARAIYADVGVPSKHIHQIYPLLARLEAQKGNMALAYKYADSAATAKDSIYSNSKTLMLSKTQQHIEAEKHVADVQQLNDQKRIQIIIRNSLLLGLLLLGGMALLFINHQKLAAKRREERLAAEKTLLDTELNNATEQLNMFTKSIHEKNELIEKFAADLESLQIQKGVIVDYNLEHVTQLRESTILTDDEWEHFRKLFEKVHGGYLERLKEKLPGLSPAETRFMALSKLRMSNKEMAGVLGISTDAVRMNKHRLRKKLNMSEESIDELVSTL